MTERTRWYVSLILFAWMGICLSPAQTPPAGDAPRKQAAPPVQPAVDLPPPSEPAPVDTAGQDVSKLPSPPWPVEEESSGEASLGRLRSRVDLPRSSVIKAILGFVALLALAYLAGQPRARVIEEKLGITHLVTAGFLFVLLGMAARHPALGILSDSILYEISPLLPVGLGWIGFSIGFRFDAHLLARLPRDTGAAVFLATSTPFLLIVGGCAAILFSASGLLASQLALRDAILLGAAGAMTARSVPFSPELGLSRDEMVRVSRFVQLEQIAGVVGLMLVAAYFRPQGVGVAWQLPGTAWLFITMGIGTTAGLFIYAALTKLSSGPQFTVVLLGSVCFAAGMASFLRLSPVAVCFIAGVILVNFPSEWKEPVREVLQRLERPIYFLFLTIAGALWTGAEWQGWALMVVFFAMRLIGKWLGMKIAFRQGYGDFSEQEERSLVIAPMGALSIAIAMNAQDLYPSRTVSWIVTAVIGGAIVNEVILQFLTRRNRNSGLGGMAEEAE